MRIFSSLNDKDRGEKRKLFIVWSFLAFVFYSGYKPGFFYSDTYTQLLEALSYSFGNWHPAIMQMFWAFLFPFFGTSSIFLFHVIVYWVSFILLSHWLIDCNKRFPISLLVLAVAPTALHGLVWVVKDVGLGVSVLFLASMYLKLNKKGRFAIAEILIVLFFLYYAVNIRLGMVVVLAPLSALFILLYYRDLGKGFFSRLILSCFLGLLLNLSFSIVQSSINTVLDVKENTMSHPYYFDMIGTLSRVKGGAIAEFPDDFIQKGKNRDDLVKAYWSNPTYGDSFARWGKAADLVVLDVGKKAVKSWLKIIIHHPKEYFLHRLNFTITYLNKRTLRNISSNFINYNNFANFQRFKNKVYIKKGYGEKIASLKAEKVIQSTLHNENYISIMTHKWVSFFSFLFTPWLHVVFHFTVFFFYLIKRQNSLPFTLSVISLLTFVLMWLFAPVPDTSRYSYLSMLISGVLIWLLYIKKVYKISEVGLAE